LHRVFVFLHVGLTDSHFFGDGRCSFFIHFRSGGSGKVTGLCSDGMILVGERFGSDGGMGGFCGILLILIIMGLLSIIVVKCLVSGVRVVGFLIL
jgi:hypothetical protein